VIDQAVILAAGLGSRLATAEDDLPKPLRVVAGLSLLKRTLLTMARGGVRRAFVVVGYQADRVRAAAKDDPDYAKAGLTVEFIDNPDYQKSNGVSVLAVKGKVEGPFLLSMSDHVYEPAMVELARAGDMREADLYLCVDPRLDEIYDPDDATKVKTEDGRIVDIGKTIPEYDCVDCGVFAVSPALLTCLEEVRTEKGDCSLSDGVRRLADKRRARVIPITQRGDVFWQDVDTPGARERAENELFRRLRKPVDGPVARVINRPLSLRVTRLLIDSKVTPNMMTVVAGLIGFTGVAVVAAAPTHLAVFVGALMLQIQSILDGCDGEIARLKFQGSKSGEWLDNVTDDVLNIVYCGALGVASARLFGTPLLAWIGLGGAAAFTLFCAVMYHQLATVHRSGSPFHMRWWFQSDGEDVKAALEKPGVVNRVTGAIRALARRDVFLFLFLVLAALGWSHVAVLWYAFVGLTNGGAAAIHLAAGGPAAARRAAAKS
jgi:CDP-L-myo-inositol myo-inositolphosphotransferase